MNKEELRKIIKKNRNPFSMTKYKIWLMLKLFGSLKNCSIDFHVKFPKDQFYVNGVSVNNWNHIGIVKK